MRLRPLFFVAVAACASGGGEHPDAPGRADAGIDGPDGLDDPDGPPADGPREPPRPAPLLLTEISLAPSAGELIEIVNPTTVEVSLDGYYLSDASEYFRVPEGAPAVDATDFVVKFPPGATIGPRGVVTVALDTAANFLTTYAVPPTFSIADGTMISVAANGVASLTNGGELVALFYWNGKDDLVHDIDLMMAGAPTAANRLISKTGIAIDGPDPDTDLSAYAADALTMPLQAAAPGTGKSTKRIALEAGHEVQGGAGNGLSGDDETTEDILATWDSTFTAPTPGVVPPELVP